MSERIVEGSIFEELFVYSLTAKIINGLNFSKTGEVVISEEEINGMLPVDVEVEDKERMVNLSIERVLKRFEPLTVWFSRAMNLTKNEDGTYIITTNKIKARISKE